MKVLTYSLGALREEDAMCMKIMYIAIVGTMTINAMETQELGWKVHVVHHFGKNADYYDFKLFGDLASDGFKLTLYGKKYGDKKMDSLPLFNEERPIMQFAPKVLLNKSTQYISFDGNWRVTVARRPLVEGEYEVISQYRRYRVSEEEQESCKNICTILAAWLRSWCKKDKTATS